MTSLGFGASGVESVFRGVRWSGGQKSGPAEAAGERRLERKSERLWSNTCFLVDVCLCHNSSHNSARLAASAQEKLLVRAAGETAGQV